VNSTQLTTTISAADIASSGTATVTVRVNNLTYGNITTAARSFTVSGGTQRYLYLPVVIVNWPPIVGHTYTPSTDDTNLRTINAGTWYGNYIDYAVGNSTASQVPVGVARVIMRFDLSSIPSNTYIKSATLQPYLTGYIYSSGQSPNMAITAYRINQAWPASPTWNNFSNAFAESYGSTTVGTSFTRYSIDVTALAQGWVNGAWPNYGIMLRGQEGGYINAKIFSSANGSSSYRPWLVVEYPDPAGATVTVAFPAEPVEGADAPSTLDHLFPMSEDDLVFEYVR
jgi:hypothetical protein